MGNLCPTRDGESPSAGHVSLPPPPTTPSPPPKKLDPKDFMINNAIDALIVRKPGSIAGQQFIVDTASNCDIFLFDYSAQIMIDFATNCRIFIGPCESSVFLRDCRDCRVVCACQQLRTRDCINLHMQLFCSTQPSIETSSGLTLSCFQYSYFNLAEQFKAAGLSIWNNQWSAVHDFNESESEVHYKLVEHDVPANELLGKSADSVCDAISAAESSQRSFVPLTAGKIIKPTGGYFALAIDNPDQSAFSVVRSVRADCPSAALIETRQGKLSKSQIEVLFLNGGTIDGGLRRRAEGAQVIGLLFDGMTRAPAHTDGVFIAEDIQISKYMANCFFNQFKPTI